MLRARILHKTSELFMFFKVFRSFGGTILLKIAIAKKDNILIL